MLLSNTVGASSFFRTRSFTGERRPGTVPDGMASLFIVVMISWIISGPQFAPNERGLKGFMWVAQAARMGYR